MRRTASPTGATTSGPTTGGCGRCWPSCRPACRSSRRRRPRTRASAATSPSSSAPALTARRWCCAGRSTATACTWPSSRCPPPQQRLGWLAAHLAELPGSGIIYTLTVAAAHETAAFLRERGHQVLPYTGKDDPADRQAAEDALLANELKALVATSALGMGFDKPDLGFVVHLGAPQSPIAYYQQIGRAGRGVDHADVILLPGREDADIWAYFGSLAFPAEAVVRRTLSALADAGRPLSTAALETRVDLSRSQAGDDAEGPRRRRRGPAGRRRLDGDRPGRGVTTPTATPGSPPSAPASSRPCSATSPRTAAGWTTCAASSTIRPRRRAGGATTAPGGTGPTTSRLRRQRRPRPAARVPAPRSSRARCGRRACASSASTSPARSGRTCRPMPGRALGRLTDLGWGPRLRAVLGPARRPTGRCPTDLVAAVVKVLADLAMGRAAGRRRQHPVAHSAAAHREPGRPDRRDRPDALPRPARVLRRRPGRSPAASTTAPSGCARSGTASSCPTRSAPRSPACRDRSCWSTT